APLYPSEKHGRREARPTDRRRRPGAAAGARPGYRVLLGPGGRVPAGP
ncbi:MAG: hypothetical protein AVDCRST_MAG03-692, partial [uncultured Rubrobacteraceae bacterium]